MNVSAEVHVKYLFLNMSLTCGMIMSEKDRAAKQKSTGGQKQGQRGGFHPGVLVFCSQWTWGRWLHWHFLELKRLVSTATLPSRTLRQQRHTVAHEASQTWSITSCATGLVFNSFRLEKVHYHIWWSSIIYSTMRNQYEAKQQLWLVPSSVLD